MLLVVPELRVKARFMIHAHVQASRCFFDNTEAFPGVLVTVFVVCVTLL